MKRPLIAFLLGVASGAGASVLVLRGPTDLTLGLAVSSERMESLTKNCRIALRDPELQDAVERVLDDPSTPFKDAEVTVDGRSCAFRFSSVTEPLLGGVGVVMSTNAQLTRVDLYEWGDPVLPAVNRPSFHVFVSSYEQAGRRRRLAMSTKGKGTALLLDEK